MSTNPFFEHWNTPFKTPPFGQIRPEHFRPAYERAFADHALEISRIAADPSTPSFENTIIALEKSGHMLSRIDLVFGNLAASDTN
jgi:peptidyl-dipeptidase Dcp